MPTLIKKGFSNFDHLIDKLSREFIDNIFKYLIIRNESSTEVSSFDLLIDQAAKIVFLRDMAYESMYNHPIAYILFDLEPTATGITIFTHTLTEYLVAGVSSDEESEFYNQLLRKYGLNKVVLRLEE